MRPDGNSARVRDAVAILLVAAGYLSAFAGLLTRIGDEGTLVHGAAMTAAGATPYRDFADLVNPLSYYWLAAWFSVFGTSFAVARWQLVFTGALTAALVYWLAARAYGVRAGVQAALFAVVLGIPLWPGTNHHWDSNLFFLASIGCLAWWQVRGGLLPGCLAGACAAMTSGFVIDKGALACLVGLVVAWNGVPATSAAGTGATTGRRASATHRWTAMAAVAGCAAAGIGVMAAWFALRGAWSEFLYVNLIFPASRYDATRHLPYAYYFSDLAWRTPLAQFSRLAPGGLAYLATAVTALPLAVMVLTPMLAAGLLLRHRLVRQAWTPARLLLWVGGTALLVSEGHRWDLYHLTYGMPLLLAAVIGEFTEDGRFAHWRRGVAMALTASALLMGVWQGALAMAARVPLPTRRGLVRTAGVDGVNDAVRFLQERTQPGEAVYVYPYYPMLYFLAEVRNPTRFGILMYGYNTPEQFHESVAALERERPRYVLWDTTVDGDGWARWYPGFVPPHDDDLIIEPYLRAHYRQVGEVSGFRVLERE